LADKLDGVVDELVLLGEDAKRSAGGWPTCSGAGSSAIRRLRADLDRAYHLLEHGLGQLDRPRQDLNAIHTP
jgi:hypothetical protein